MQCVYMYMCVYTITQLAAAAFSRERETRGYSPGIFCVFVSALFFADRFVLFLISLFGIGGRPADRKASGPRSVCGLERRLRELEFDFFSYSGVIDSILFVRVVFENRGWTPKPFRGLIGNSRIQCEVSGGCDDESFRRTPTKFLGVPRLISARCAILKN